MKETISSIELNCGGDRAIGVLDGALVMCDWTDGVGWVASGEPARQGFEVDSLNAMIRARGEGTTVIVTPPEGE